MQTCVENVDISICVCKKKKIHFDQRPKVSHYQVQRADVCVDNPSEHTEVLTEVVWRDQKRSRAAHYCHKQPWKRMHTHKPPPTPQVSPPCCPVVHVCQQRPLLTHTHQHSWHRGT